VRTSFVTAETTPPRSRAGGWAVAIQADSSHSVSHPGTCQAPVRTMVDGGLTCEPPVGIEPTTCSLREACPPSHLASTCNYARSADRSGQPAQHSEPQFRPTNDPTTRALSGRPWTPTTDAEPSGTRSVAPGYGGSARLAVDKRVDEDPDCCPSGHP